MRLVIALEVRFTRTPDGAVWTMDGHSYDFFARYLGAFDRVRVVARVADSMTADGHRVDGPGVEVHAVRHYVGPRQYLTHRAAIIRSVLAGDDHAGALLLRAPSQLGSLLAAARERVGQPYAVEVIADPWTVFAPGVVHHPLRPILRSVHTRRLRHQCAKAIGVAYVTEQYLQSRYPASADAVTAGYSCVDLPTEAFLDRPRAPSGGVSDPILISVGSLEQLYKGIDTLIRAVGRLTATGTPVRLVHVGAGRCRPHLERLTAALGLADRVEFVGALPAGAEVRRLLDTADLFVMPSRTEGLPKALIEAMARGLPAVGTAVGGIPELLAAEELVAPDDVDGLASAIRRLLADPRRLAEASARNLLKAAGFSREVLAARRGAFYEQVQDSVAQRNRRGAAGEGTFGTARSTAAQ